MSVVVLAVLWAHAFAPSMHTAHAVRAHVARAHVDASIGPFVRKAAFGAFGVLSVTGAVTGVQELVSLVQSGAERSATMQSAAGVAVDALVLSTVVSVFLKADKPDASPSQSAQPEPTDDATQNTRTP